VSAWRRRRRAGPQTGAGAGQAPVPGTAPPPAAALGGPGRGDTLRGDTPPGPAPALTPQETAALERLHRARAAIPPRGAHAAREVADGLRERFPGLDDTTLGLVTLDLYGYVQAIAAAIPAPAGALQAITDVFGLAAEELTRLAREPEVAP
jgi:hypothetical protein